MGDSSVVEIETPSRTEERPGSVVGEIVLGNIDPKSLTREAFEKSSSLLYHGAAKEFVYSPRGEFDRSNTGGDGSEDFGSGIYLTDNKKLAENYSLVRSMHHLQNPLVYNFLPYNAKMLDVRDKGDLGFNGELPRSFVNEWVDFLEKYLLEDKNFKDFKSEHLASIIKDGIKKEFLERTKRDVKNNKKIDIRGELDGAGIFGRDKNGLIGIPFNEFMISKGYDGMIYREGGEGEKKEDLNGYVFYNLKRLDTWEGWQKRITTPPSSSSQ